MPTVCQDEDPAMQHIEARLRLPDEAEQVDAVRELWDIAMQGEAGAGDLLERVLAPNAADGWSCAPMARKAAADALVAYAGRWGGISPLQAAVSGYRVLIRDDWTREGEATHWAAAQHDLGRALKNLADHTGDARLYEEAIAAYRQALEVYTRDARPEDWAMAQNNLGCALDSFADQTGDVKRYEEAIATYRLALEVQTRDAMPVDWAMVQGNLCVALSHLGTLTGNASFLEQAIAACQQALEVYTQDERPEDWAVAQVNLGVALEILAGVAPSDRIIVNPSDSLVSGTVVRVAPSAPTAAKK